MLFTLLPLLFAMFFLGLAFVFPPVKRNIAIALSLLVTLAWVFTFAQVVPSSFAYPTRITPLLNSPLPTPAPTETPLPGIFEWPSNIVDIPIPTAFIDLKGFTSMFSIKYEHMLMSMVPYFVFAVIILVMVILVLAIVLAKTHLRLAQLQTQLDVQATNAANIEQLFTARMLQFDKKLESKLEVFLINEKQTFENITRIDNFEKLARNITATLEVGRCQATNYNATFAANSKAIDLLNRQMDIVIKTLAAHAKDTANKK